ncbi:MAG TPA: HAD-IIB family hydrolase [Patescibacteria group bacterium]|nr:HAD-IIB family hydrolase [Patescibacteria group bacterium]
MKKIIVFDLDDTLAVTKSPITDTMGELLVELTKYYDICIITGGRYEQIIANAIERLPLDAAAFTHFHLMPTAGTQYYRYDLAKNEWVRQYIEALPDEDKKRIIDALEKGAKSLGMWPANPAGPVIDDRESLIAFSALGQKAKPEDKYAWDPDRTKRKKLREVVAAMIPDFEVNIDATTSLNILRPGIDKGYGMKKLLETTGLKESDLLFIGDQLEEGGNDYPVKALGIDTIAVARWEDTAMVVRGMLGVAGG